MSTIPIRPARPDDQPAIAAFTKDTFAWGDYVAEAFTRWLDDPRGLIAVATDPDDVPVAMSRATLLSDDEAWFQGARVREEWRRRGIAGDLADYLTGWAHDRGARVGRLLVEDWNTAARSQVGASGFRAVGEWVSAERSVGAASPLPSGNGGRRVPALEQLARANSAEAEPAYMSWSTGPLGRAARGMVAVGWTWRRLMAIDLVTAAKAGALWAARSGWALAARNDETLEVGWIETRQEDAPDLIRALVDLAVHEGVDQIQMKLPAIDWLTTAARRAGCELWDMVLYEKAL